jgi:hypothetical protein
MSLIISGMSAPCDQSCSMQLTGNKMQCSTRGWIYSPSCYCLSIMTNLPCLHNKGETECASLHFAWESESPWLCPLLNSQILQVSTEHTNPSCPHTDPQHSTACNSVVFIPFNPPSSPSIRPSPSIHYIYP